VQSHLHFTVNNNDNNDIFVEHHGIVS